MSESIYEWVTFLLYGSPVDVSNILLACYKHTYSFISVHCSLTSPAFKRRAAIRLLFSDSLQRRHLSHRAVVQRLKVSLNHR